MSAERAESPISIREAVLADVPLVLRFIRELADYERLADQVVATEESLALPGPGPAARRPPEAKP